MNKKRFPSWTPKVGDRALVPGGPACAQYVSELNESDVEAINSGHRGYTPLRVRIYSPESLNTPYPFSDVVYYDEKKRLWFSSMGGYEKTLKGCISLATQYNRSKCIADAA